MDKEYKHHLHSHSESNQTIYYGCFRAAEILEWVFTEYDILIETPTNLNTLFIFYFTH